MSQIILSYLLLMISVLSNVFSSPVEVNSSKSSTDPSISAIAAGIWKPHTAHPIGSYYPSNATGDILNTTRCYCVSSDWERDHVFGYVCGQPVYQNSESIHKKRPMAGNIANADARNWLNSSIYLPTTTTITTPSTPSTSAALPASQPGYTTTPTPNPPASSKNPMGNTASTLPPTLTPSLKP